MKRFLDKRGSFGSRFGAIVAVGGSVVGLGNIWRVKTEEELLFWPI